MDLADIMATSFATVTPELSVADAARRMIEIDTGAAVVLDDGGQLVGVISERDLLRHISAGADPTASVAERMTRHVLTASPETTMPEAMALMVDGHFRHLPVLSDGRVIGMISMRDLMAWAALRLRHGAFEGADDVDTAELLATIHRMRTGAA
jgi:CBS domain-containing protein